MTADKVFVNIITKTNVIIITIIITTIIIIMIIVYVTNQSNVILASLLCMYVKVANQCVFIIIFYHKTS